MQVITPILYTIIPADMVPGTLYLDAKGRPWCVVESPEGEYLYMLIGGLMTRTEANIPKENYPFTQAPSGYKVELIQK